MKITRGTRLKESKIFYPKGKDLFLFKCRLKQIFNNL